MQKKTKIVCSIGPASGSYEMLTKLIRSGMNVMRLNFSHGGHTEKTEQVKFIRKISKEQGIPIMVLADLQGPKIRLGIIDGIRKIAKGDVVILSVNPLLDDELPMQFDLSAHVKKGQRVFLNDALVELEVISVQKGLIRTKAKNSGWVSSNKGINVPDTYIKKAAFTEKDREDAIFALEQNVDYIALSFVQTANDIEELRTLIKSKKSRAKVMVKLEKPKAIENLEEIIRSTDAVMIARGDLGIEVDPFDVPIIQQRIIRMCRQFQKPVIVATQMLESMTENPRPTRAEVSDVANSVLDQVDAVMLSAETATGKYPVEAVEIMADTIKSVEKNLEFKNYIKIDWANIEKEDLEFNAIASSAASIAFRVGAKMIIAATASGKTAQMVSSFRPDAQILAVTHDEKTRDQLSLVWGVTSCIIKASGSFDKFYEHILEHIKEHHLVTKGDKVVIVTGKALGISGSTDTVKVATI